MSRSFNGTTSDHLDDGAAGALTAGDFSISFWLNPVSVGDVSTVQPVIACKGVDGTNGYYVLLAQGNAGDIAFISCSPSDAITKSVGGALTTSSWQHVLITRSGATVKIYKNGTEVSYAATGSHGTIVSASANFAVGYYPPSASNTKYHYNGLLAEVALWNMALTGADATSLAGGAAANTVEAANLQDYWILGGTSSPEPDSVGANNLTVTGTAAGGSNPPVSHGSATDFTFAPSSQTTQPGVATGNYTITPNGTPSSSTAVALSDGGAGGTFTPSSLTFTTSTAQTFTYTPSNSATNGQTITLTATASGGFSASHTAAAVISVVAATAYTISGPSPNMGVRGAASGTYTVTPNGSYTGTITITPSGGGLSSPIALTWSNSSVAKTFTITPPSAGAVVLTPSASPALGTDPLPLSYVSMKTLNLVFKGDSLTYGQNASSGAGTTTGTCYPGVVMTQLQGANSWFAAVNKGVQSQRVDTMLGIVASDVQPAYNGSDDLNIAIIMAGSNDIGGTNDGTHSGARAASAVYADLNTYCKTIQGYGFKVIVMTIPPSSQGVWIADFDTVRDQYNDLIRANWKNFADGIADHAADSRIGFDGDETNSTYFNSTDKTHLTDAGYAIVAGFATDAIRAVVNGASAAGGSGLLGGSGGYLGGLS